VRQRSNPTLEQTIFIYCNVKSFLETYQLILIRRDCSENGFWEDIGSIFFLLNVCDGMVGALGPDD
jgi:hypothetical protein